MAKIKFPREIREAPSVFEVKTGGFMTQWCCGCGLRHIWHFRIVRGKKSSDDQVEISLLCDDLATHMLKQLNRRKKR